MNGGGTAMRLWPLRRMPVARAIDPADAVEVVLRKAEPRDLPGIAELLERYARRGLVLPRTTEQLAARLDEFVVVEHDGAIAGCAALRVFDSGRAEVCALAVSESLHGHGVGRAIVEHLVAEAGSRGIDRVFALTLQTQFFHRLGFRTVAIDAFPEKIAADCVSCAKRAFCPEIAVALDLTA